MDVVSHTEKQSSYSASGNTEGHYGRLRSPCSAGSSNQANVATRLQTVSSMVFPGELSFLPVLLAHGMVYVLLFSTCSDVVAATL